MQIFAARLAMRLAMSTDCATPVSKLLHHDIAFRLSVDLPTPATASHRSNARRRDGE